MEKKLSLKKIIPPPFIYLFTFFLGLFLEFFFLDYEFNTRHFYFSLFMLISSIGFARFSFLSMKKFNTSASLKEDSKALCTKGAFEYSRNPIYLSMSGIYLGFSLFLNSFLIFSFLFPLLLIMNYLVISKEEKYLESVFGTAYLEYKSKVSRWF